MRSRPFSSLVGLRVHGHNLGRWRASAKPVLVLLSFFSACLLASCDPLPPTPARILGTDTATVPSDTLSRDTSDFGIPWNRQVAFGTLVDPRDGWTYRTVAIGSDTWMAQNLEFRSERVEAGTPRPDTVGVCPHASRDSCSKYGRSYNWAEAVGAAPLYAGTLLSPSSPLQGICPTGWHLPSWKEWDALARAFGSSGVSAAMRSIAGWGTPGTDRLGLRILPAGVFDASNLHDAGSTAAFWTSEEFDASIAWYAYLDVGFDGLVRSQGGKARRMSVRCVQDRAP